MTLLSESEIREASKIRSAVREAWRSVRKPAEDSLADGNELESAEMIRLFAGKHASELCLDDPNVRGSFPLHYLSDAAIHYYLQNYLELLLSVERQDVDPDWARNHEQVSHFIGAIADLGKRTRQLFVPEQRTAVCTLLGFIEKHSAYYGVDYSVGVVDYQARLAEARTVWCAG